MSPFPLESWRNLIKLLCWSSLLWERVGEEDIEICLLSYLGEITWLRPWPLQSVSEAVSQSIIGFIAYLLGADWASQITLFPATLQTEYYCVLRKPSPERLRTAVTHKPVRCIGLHWKPRFIWIGTTVSHASGSQSEISGPIALL